jgi:uncharacterized protein YcfL
MKRFCASLPVLSLILLSACLGQVDHELNGQQVIFAPTRLGLTLQFENPRLEADARSKDRYQVKVTNAVQTQNGLEVTLTTASTQSVDSINYLCRDDGGVYIQPQAITVLPSGFPYKTTSWQSGGVNFRVIGRADADLPGVSLPDKVGVWVELTPITASSLNSGYLTTRILFLSGIGQAEARVLSQGKWLTIKKLIGLGADPWLDADPS